MKFFVTKTISYKILLHLATKYFVTHSKKKKKYFVTKTIFCCNICDGKVRR